MHQIHANYSTASVLSSSPAGISLGFVFSVKASCNGKSTGFLTEYDDVSRLVILLSNVNLEWWVCHTFIFCL